MTLNRQIERRHDESRPTNLIRATASRALASSLELLGASDALATYLDMQPWPTSMFAWHPMKGATVALGGSPVRMRR